MGFSKFPGCVEILWKRTYLVMAFPVYYWFLCYDQFSLKYEPHLTPPLDPTDLDMARYSHHFPPTISRASKSLMETDILGDGLSCVLSVSMIGSLLHSNLSHILISLPSRPHKPRYDQVVTSHPSHFSCTQKFYDNQLSW